MSGETTKSSDGREQLNVEEVATVEKQIKDAGYFFRFNAMQSQFSKTKIKQISQSSTYICKMLCSNTVPP